MAIISNGTTITDAGAFSVGLGSLVLIKTITLSSAAATIDFLNGASSVVFDSTYPIYKFQFINIHPATDSATFSFQVDTGTNTSYNQAITSTAFRAIHDEDDSPANVSYEGGNDLAQGTDFQILANDVGNDNDQSCSGYLEIVNPSSSTFTKNFMGETNFAQGANIFFNQYTAGYVNTTTALTRIRFKFHSGNIQTGTINMYGIKDS